jgi:hypothetical protein
MNFLRLKNENYIEIFLLKFVNYYDSILYL